MATKRENVSSETIRYCYDSLACCHPYRKDCNGCIEIAEKELSPCDTCCLEGTNCWERCKNEGFQA